MPPVNSPIATVAWYLRRPATWGELARAAAAKVRPPVDETALAAARCADCEIDRVEAAGRLGIELVDVTAMDEYGAARSKLAERGVHVAGAGDTAMLYSLTRDGRPGTVLETGVAHGLSSLAILLAMEANGHGRLVSVDMPYRGAFDDGYVGQAVPDRLRSRWSVLRVPDRKGIPIAVRTAGPFDFVHYDSDKTRRGREFAYPLLWDSVVPGGWLLSDDVGDDLVFLEFAERVGATPLVWRKADGKDFVGAIRKL